MENKIKHVAIIMDGNGRWAKERRRPRVWGHIRGASLVSSIVEEADNLGIKALTLYTFSTENWSRPVEEVSTLFTLLKKFLLKESERIIRNNINFKVIGDYSNLPTETKKLIIDLENRTKNFSGLKLRFAFGYGGRKEIVDAINRLIVEKREVINESDFDNYLYSPECGDVDLLIRTGGDKRISNFLLWQCAYAELFFLDIKWPDFSPQILNNILIEVEGRERRFGSIKSESDLESVKNRAQINKKNIVNLVEGQIGV